MSTRIMMANYKKVGKALEDEVTFRSPFSSEKKENEEFYEAGMREVLAETAKLHYMYHAIDFLKINRPLEFMERAVRDVDNGYETMINQLSEEQQEAFRVYDEDRVFLESLNEEDRFIQGFIYGYQYLKQITASFKV
ncbi:hypothetical protein WMW72_34110 [Paenibacillus filicis]|uniref:TipAS antibiotic-recognition domain-containing protein n=1 Tax=Paenibacillus filicis TaxID=669464 RepID=A0ABU9DW57_9BACL